MNQADHEHPIPYPPNAKVVVGWDNRPQIASKARGRMLTLWQGDPAGSIKEAIEVGRGELADHQEIDE